MDLWRIMIPICVTIFCVHCISGHICTMTDYQKTKCLETDLDEETQVGDNLEVCKDICLANTSCQATQRKGGDCFFVFKSFKAVKSAGATLSVKNCSATTSTATTSTATTPTATTTTSTTISQATTSTATITSTSATVSQGKCSWSRLADTAGRNPAITVTLTDYDQCETACRSLVDCIELGYDTGSNTCKLYTSSTTPVSAAGNVFGRKQQCPSGCCYNRFPDTAGGNNQLILLTPSLDSCEDLCYILTDCVAISFTEKSCSIFTESTQADQKLGVTTSLKNCSSGRTSTDAKFSTVCLGGSTIQPVILVVLLMAAAAIKLGGKP